MSGTINIRPKNQPNAPIYSPGRDLVHLYIPMTKEAFAGLTPDVWSPAVQEFVDQHNITNEELCDGVVKFAEAHQLFVREDGGVNEPEEAFRRTGFAELRFPVKAMIFQRLGEVIMGGWFVAFRQCTLQGEESPLEEELAKMVTVGRRAANVLSGHNPDQRLVPERYEHLIEWQKQIRKALAQQNEANRALENDNYQLNKLLETTKAEAEKDSFVLTTVRSLLSRGSSWAIFKYAVKLWWTRRLDIL